MTAWQKRESIAIGERLIGAGQPTYVIAEIGINHNGSLEMTRKLIDGAVLSGCQAVKFQKRTPELCVPRDQWDIERDTPWGRMTYLDYRRKIEFGEAEYRQIDKYCRERDIQWTASCWDEPSVEFMEKFNPPFFKAASASLTDHSLLKKMKATGRPLMISTGMSTIEEIETAVSAIGTDQLLIAHSTSAYPCKLEELNLKMIPTLLSKYPGVQVGYSGHETGLIPSCAAVTLGASFIERHITLDRALWGTDQSASVEVVGLHRLVTYIRDIEKTLGDGVKRVYESEVSSRKKLRRVPGAAPAAEARA